MRKLDYISATYTEAQKEAMRVYKRPFIDRLNNQDIIAFFNLEKSRVSGYNCPICNSGRGKHGTGAEVTKDRRRLTCFAGGHFGTTPSGSPAAGDILDILKITTGQTENEILKQYFPEYDIKEALNGGGQPPRVPQNATETTKAEPTIETADKKESDYTGYFRACNKRLGDPAALEYLALRGISKDLADRFLIGYDPEWRSPAAIEAGKNPPASPRLIIPTARGSYIARDTRPDVEICQKMKEGKLNLFNAKDLYNEAAQPVFIVEGEIDALSIIEAGGRAVALGTTTVWRKLINLLQEKPTAAPLILCLDNEPQGQEAEAKLAEGLQALNISFTRVNICGSSKDPNEALTTDITAFTEALRSAEAEAAAAKEQAEKEREQRTGAGMIDAFIETVKTQKYKPMPTGLADLDRITGGGFVRQTIVMLAAAPAMGKTTLTMQIFETMAEKGQDIIYLNLEMSREQLIAKSLCREIWQGQKKTITTAEIMQGYKWTQEQERIITKAAADFKERKAAHIMYNPPEVTAQLDSITSFLQAEAERCRAAGKEAPLVVLDYLHLIQGEAREDAAATIKRAVMELKRFAVEYNTVVFCILATNRDSNARGKMILESGRDTSNIEFSADLFLGLNFTDWENSKKEEKKSFEVLKRQPQREITLKCLKNRMGEDGASMQLLFDTKHGEFTQVDTRHAAADDWRTGSANRF